MLEPLITTITTSSSANSQQTVYSLLAAITPKIAGLRRVCCDLKLQADAFGGATKYAAGNSNVSASNGSAGSGIGVQLIAGQTYELGPFESNLVHLDEIYVTTSVGSSIFNITVVCR